MSTPPTKRARALTAIIVVAGLIGLGYLPVSRIMHRMRAGDTRVAPQAPSAPGAMGNALALARGWVNGSAESEASLSGHPSVALVWSDTDPASLRALAAAETWRAAYARWGVRVVGVHAPDFAFAADSAVAARAARTAGVHFAIALDPAGEIRRRLGAGDRVPFAAVADSSGAIVARLTGNAALAAERHLREQVVKLNPDQRFPAGGSADPALAPLARTIYLGSARVSEGPIASAAPGHPSAFTAEFRYQIEGKAFVPYPVGWWTPDADGITAARGGPGNLVALRYSGGALDAVIAPPPNGKARLWILRDEKWLDAGSLGTDARLDARGASYVDVDEPRLYSLARGGSEHVVKLSPDAAGITLHALIVDPAAESAGPGAH
jgi:hypothetical protein